VTTIHRKRENPELIIEKKIRHLFTNALLCFFSLQRQVNKKLWLNLLSDETKIIRNSSLWNLLQNTQIMVLTGC